jgi:tRNA/tmRNA/rRNA uracil-C5-methylase (TrmA/RlmC/RlmD family)
MGTVDLTIHDVAFGGKGVGRDGGGKAVFVPYTIDGETVTAEIVRDKKQFAEAELIEVLEASPHRVSPECPYFGNCGGCAYQHIDYPHQLDIKWRQVRDVLRRIGQITDAPIRPIIPSPVAYGYRNRITVHVLDGVIGFFRRESNRLIDVERCPISNDNVNEKLKALRQSNPRDGHYTLRADDRPRVFAQTNDAAAGRLRELVVSLVPDNQELLIDAYCGSGFFAKALLEKFERVIGIDWDRFAIEEASRTAGPKETYIAGNVEDALAHSRSGGFPTADQGKPSGRENSAPNKDSRASTIIVDPPATGLTKSICNCITDLSPDKFIYVSCNPATLARDLKQFIPHFALQSVTPLDMFPQTAEIEVVVELGRMV